MDGTAPAGARPAIRSAHDARALVVNTITEHAESLLTLARQHSLCADDAYDAYQRGLEIFLRHAPGLDAERAHSWLLTVVRRQSRQFFPLLRRRAHELQPLLPPTSSRGDPPCLVGNLGRDRAMP